MDQIPYVHPSIERPVLSEPPDQLHNETFSDVAKSFLEQLQRAVQRRITNLPSLCRECKRASAALLRPSHGCEHPKLAILFSGGIDSTVIAALTDRILPLSEPVDLLNVAFFSEVSSPPADRQTGK